MLTKKTPPTPPTRRIAAKRHAVPRARKGRPGASPLALRGPSKDPYTVDLHTIQVVVKGGGGALSRTVQVPHPAGMRELELGLEGALFAVEQLSARRAPSVGTLSEAEMALFEQGGLPAPDPARKTASDVGAVEYGMLLDHSLSVDEAARLMTVNGSRIRQRLASRELFGIKDGRSWRIPRFQFDRGRLVPGIEQVLPVLPEGMHPVAVNRWLKTPNEDLEIEADAIVSPLEWLTSGRDPSRVRELAASL